MGALSIYIRDSFFILFAFLSILGMSFGAILMGAVFFGQFAVSLSGLGIFLFSGIFLFFIDDKM